MKLTNPIQAAWKAVCLSGYLALLTLGPFVSYAADTTPKPTPTPTPGAPSGKASADAKDMKEIQPTVAEKSTSPFSVRIGIPGWASAISGDIGVRGRVTPAQYISFTNVFQRLDYIIPGSIEVGYGKWGLLLDGQYAKLSETLNTRDIVFKSAQIEMEQAFAELNISYKVIDTDKFSLAPFIGTRFEYIRISGQASTVGRFLATRSFDESKETEWADPILGFQAKYQICKPLALVAKADVGGFGAASHLTYQFFAGAQTQITRNIYVSGGYRYLQTDYYSNGFTYNMAFSGPQITFGVNF